LVIQKIVLTLAGHIFCAIGHQIVILQLLEVKHLICGIQGGCIGRKGWLAGNYWDKLKVN